MSRPAGGRTESLVKLRCSRSIRSSREGWWGSDLGVSVWGVFAQDILSGHSSLPPSADWSPAGR